MADTTPTTGQKVKAAVDTAGVDTMGIWQSAWAYVPTKYKGIVALAATGLVLWNFGATIWNHVPSRAAVTPATMSDLAGSDAANAALRKDIGALSARLTVVETDSKVMKAAPVAIPAPAPVPATRARKIRLAPVAE